MINENQVIFANGIMLGFALGLSILFIVIMVDICIKAYNNLKQDKDKEEKQ